MRPTRSSYCLKDTMFEVNLMNDSENATYHSRCYKNYTAVKKKSSKPPVENSSDKPKTWCRSTQPPSDSKGLLKCSCIFYPVDRKQVKCKREPLSDCLTMEGCNAVWKLLQKAATNA